MLIRCPECGFEREIDPDGIAPTAVRATCPRCKTKFYFRNPDGSFIAFTPTSASETSVPAEASSAVQAAAPSRHEDPQNYDDDPLPPGAVIPDLPGLKLPPDEPEEPVTPAASPRQRPAPAEANTGEAASSKTGPSASRNTAAAKPGKRGLLAVFEERLREARAALGRKQGEEEATEDEEAGTLGKPKAPEDSEQDVPWELPEKYGFLPSLYQTILRVLFGAPRFFAALPKSTTPWIRPVTFYVILGVFQTVMERMWYLMSFQAMGPSITDPKVQELLGAMAHEMSLPMALLLSPVTLFMQLAFYTVLFFLMVRLVQPESASFPLMLRIIAYSSAPAVVCVVPLVGTLANAVWFAVCCCIGCKYALNMAWSRVLLALGPLYLVAFAVLGQFMRQLMGS